MIETLALFFGVVTPGRNSKNKIGEISMKKKFLLPCLFLIAAILLTAAVSFGVGAAETVTMTDVKNGTDVAEGSVVTVSSVEEYGYFAEYVNAGNLTAGVIFRQTADIIFPDWEGCMNFPLVGTEEHPFAGTYEGGTFKLGDLTFAVYGGQSGEEVVAGAYFAPFAYTDGATLRDVTVALSPYDLSYMTEPREGYDIPFFGGIAGYAKNTSIVNCQTLEKVVGSADIALPAMAGIVVKAENSLIDSCVNQLYIVGKANVAGIVSQADATVVRNCLNCGSVGYQNAARVAGIAATVTGESVVENCYNSGPVTGKTQTGALVGLLGAGAKLQNCFVNGKMEGNGASFGILVGENAGAVSYCYGFDSRRTEADELALIGTGDGTAETIYAFRKNSTEDGVAYILGEIRTGVEESVLHAEVDPTAHDKDSTCQVCLPDGYVHDVTMHRFLALENKLTIGSVSGIEKLDVALNTWCEELGEEGVTYAAWTVKSNGDIINCKHNITKFDKAPSCEGEVIANEVCDTCGKVMRTDVVLPQIAHTWGEDSTCSTYQTCTVCGAINEEVPLKPHQFPDGIAACEAANCENCGTARTLENDPTMTEHTPDREAADCTHDKVCTVCGLVLEEASGHIAMPASCEGARYCTKCGELVHEQLAHTWLPATCAEARKCKICGTEDDSPEGAATGLHTWNIDEPTCTMRKYCTVCYLQESKALGHLPGEEADCGHAQKCERCHGVLVNATGEHTFDMSTLTIIKEPGVDSWGEYTLQCTHCGLTVMQNFVYLPAASENSQADVKVVDGDACLPIGVTIEALKKQIADFNDAKIADSYTLLQVMDITLKDMQGEVYTMDGKMTVRMQLNKSAAKMSVEQVKLYYIAPDGTVSEVAIKEWADGYVTFETDHFSVYAIAADTGAAIEKLGSTGGQNPSGEGEGQEPSSNAGLPVGAIVAIVVGAVAVVAAVVVLVLVFGKKQKGAKSDKKDDSED